MRRTWLVIAICAVLLFGGYFLINILVRPDSSEQNNSLKKFHFSTYSKEEFYTGLIRPAEVELVSSQVYGGIVSHHFLVEREIARFFLSLQNQSFKTVVVVGPNHLNIGREYSLVSRLSYRTPWGDLEIDNDIIEQLLLENVAWNNEMPFEREHSVALLTGFIKKVMPQAKFVPIILKHNAPLSEVERLAAILYKILPEPSLVLASVDFSHNVDYQTAASQDLKSTETLKTFDCRRVYKLSLKELDSPPSICTLLKYLELKQAKVGSYKNVNSATFMNNFDSQDVTSYIFAYFTKS